MNKKVVIDKPASVEDTVKIFKISKRRQKKIEELVDKVMEVHSFEERQKQKQASRDQDAEDLRSGKKTVEELNAENAKFAFPGAIVDINSAKRSW